MFHIAQYFPITDPTLIFFVVLLIILFAPIIMGKLRIPHIIGMVLAGVLIGKYGLNILERDSSFELFGKVGLYYIMFLAALEMDMEGMKKNKSRLLIYGLLTCFVPFFLTFGMSIWLLHYSIRASFLLSCIMASNTLIAYPIVSRYGLQQKPSVTLSVGSSMLSLLIALIMLAGAGMNFVLGFVVMAILITAQNEPITSKVLYQVEENALCGQTGLQAGDKILAVNGRRCFVANDILYELMRTEDYTADFTVLRDGKKVELPGVQFDTWQDDKGETHMSLGFTVYGIKKTPLNVLKEAGNSVLYYGRIIFASLSDLLRGRESINDLSGPVGIVTAIGQAASYGWQDLLELLVLITVNLGIFNLLPFPALDGGKVVFLLIEGVTGHAVPEKIQSGLTVAAFALLFGLMIFATYNDILRLITGAM